MKQRKHKFSLGIKIASILSCIALISVGFASWWIVKMPDPARETGAFTVYAVETKEVNFNNVDLDKTLDDENPRKGAFIFGTTTDVTETWLWAKDIDAEKLTTTLTFDVNLVEGTASESNLDAMLNAVTLTLAPREGSNFANLNAAISAGYLKNPTMTYSYKLNDQTEKTDTVTYKNGMPELSIEIEDGKVGKSISVTVDITFEWGTAFNGTNPYEFYNGGAYTADANTALTALHNIGAINYDVTLTAVAAH